MIGGDVPARTYRVYFARAVDELPRTEVLARGRALAAQLRKSGVTLVDPVAAWDARSARSGPADLISSDLSLLGTCHAVLMDMTIPDRNYVGCVCELVYAHLWGIPSVVWVGTTGFERRPWLRHHAAAVVRTETEAVARLLALLPRR